MVTATVVDLLEACLSDVRSQKDSTGLHSSTHSTVNLTDGRKNSFFYLSSLF